MAQGIVVKIWNVTAGSGTRSAAAQISDSIAYIENPEKLGAQIDNFGAVQMGNELTYVMNDIKTAQGLYVGGRHISDFSRATEEMMQVKEFYGKTDGRVATHGVISLDAEESDPKNASKLMFLLNDLMKEIFPDNQVVYAVHTNTENLHIHFILNTVGLNGKKIHMDNTFMSKVMQPTVNRLADKYGFTRNIEWDKEKVADPLSLIDRKMLLRTIIDIAIEQTDSFDAFVAYLRKDGTKVNVGKQISIQMDGMPKAMRTGQLGENYSMSGIARRLENKFNPFVQGVTGEYYAAILPEELANITPLRMKKYKDMDANEKREAIRLLKLKRNPWLENIHNNWQMQNQADELKNIGYVYKLVHHYSNGADNCQVAMWEIVNRRKELASERKELRRLLKEYKPIIDIYEEMKKYMLRAYLYDVYGKSEYVADFMAYKELAERLEVGYHKSVEEIADYVAETKAQLFYVKKQEEELSKQYVAIKKYSDKGKLQALSDDYSFFHAIGHSEALYQAKKYGIYASEMKSIVSDNNKNLVIRVVTTPDTKEGKPTITTSISVIKDGVCVKEISSKDMDTKAFNKAIYEIQSEYDIKKCHVEKNNYQKNVRKI